MNAPCDKGTCTACKHTACVAAWQRATCSSMHGHEMAPLITWSSCNPMHSIVQHCSACCLGPAFHVSYRTSSVRAHAAPCRRHASSALHPMRFQLAVQAYSSQAHPVDLHLNNPTINNHKQPRNCACRPASQHLIQQHSNRHQHAQCNPQPTLGTSKVAQKHSWHAKRS